MVISMGYPIDVWVAVTTSCYGRIVYHLHFFPVDFSGSFDDVVMTNCSGGMCYRLHCFSAYFWIFLLHGLQCFSGMLLLLCNSMPLVWRGLTMCMVKCSYFLVLHRVSKIMLVFCLGGSRQSLKVREVKCIPGDPTTMCPVLFKGSRSLLLLA